MHGLGTGVKWLASGTTSLTAVGTATDLRETSVTRQPAHARRQQRASAESVAWAGRRRTFLVGLRRPLRAHSQKGSKQTMAEYNI